MWVARLLQKAFSFAFTLGIAGGLVDLTISMAKDSRKAARMGLVSLSSLNQQLTTGKGLCELRAEKKRRQRQDR